MLSTASIQASLAAQMLKRTFFHSEPAGAKRENGLKREHEISFAFRHLAASPIYLFEMQRGGEAARGAGCCHGVVRTLLGASFISHPDDLFSAEERRRSE